MQVAQPHFPRPPKAIQQNIKNPYQDFASRGKIYE